MTEQRQGSDASQVTALSLQWYTVLRALREARGVTQEGWAAFLGVGRTTLQRWESGKTVPDIHAEEELIRVCQEQGLFRSFGGGPFRGRSITAEFLRQVLAEARLGGEGAIEPAADKAPAAQLLEGRGEPGERRHDLRVPATTLGRSLDNDVIIEHPLVSRHHARVTWDGGRYAIEDLGSTNGTFLNGAHITTPQPLRDGDAIRLGGREAPQLVMYLPGEAITTVGEERSVPE